jgi:hypothetical protein
MKWHGIEIECPKCSCKGILREGVHGTCLECNHRFDLNKYTASMYIKLDSDERK